MIKHIVTWKVKEENKVSNMKKMKEMLEALPPKIDVIESLQVGINENGGEYDLILITEFESFEKLAEYDTHPEHQKVRAFIKGVVENRISVDFTE